MSNEKKFNHKSRDIYEAIGVSEERLARVEDRMNEITEECDKYSELIEAFSKEFSPIELAYSLVAVHRAMTAIKNERFMRDKSGEALSRLRELLEDKFAERRKTDDPLREGGSMWFGSKGEA